MKMLHNENIKSELFKKTHYTKKGNFAYNLDYAENLIIPSNFVGKKSKIRHNALGWERDNIKHFKILLNEYPEYFSKMNIEEIHKNKAPIVDDVYIKYFPQYKDFEGEKIEIHHIGRDGQVVPLPESIYDKSGEIHNVEKQIGLVKNATNFTNKVESGINEGKFDYGKDALYYYDKIEFDLIFNDYSFLDDIVFESVDDIKDYYKKYLKKTGINNVDNAKINYDEKANKHKNFYRYNK